MTDALTTPETAPPPPPPRRRRGLLWVAALCLAVASLALLALLAAGTGYGYRAADAALLTAHVAPPPPELAEPEGQKALQKALKALERSRPSNPFVVIDRVRNRLYLVEGGRVVLDATISAGAGSVLQDPSGKRKWVFDTPVGRFKVKGRREDPVWTAPDWEYIESGEPFPRNYADRRQEGMLGEYALDLDTPGYMIHGTLYSRLLGRNVSHGCIRVGRDDLRVLWKKCPIGTTVFIY